MDRVGIAWFAWPAGLVWRTSFVLPVTARTPAHSPLDGCVRVVLASRGNALRAARSHDGKRPCRGQLTCPAIWTSSRMGAPGSCTSLAGSINSRIRWYAAWPTTRCGRACPPRPELTSFSSTPWTSRSTHWSTFITVLHVLLNLKPMCPIGTPVHQRRRSSRENHVCDIKRILRRRGSQRCWTGSGAARSHRGLQAWS